MAQLQVILTYLRKYHFWLLCGVAVLVSLFGWMKASGTLSDDYQKGKSDIQGTFQQLSDVQATNPHPNGNWTQEINKLTEAKRQNVAKAWQSIYDEQQKVLAWPQVLGADFLEWIKDPKNARPEVEIPQSTRQPFRERYRNQVLTVEFPKLVAIAGAKLEADAAKKDEKNPKVTPAEDMIAAEQVNYKVAWAPESQTAVYNALKLPDDRIPDSADIRLRQEDLWVYQALLAIISRTNEGAPFSSHVKRIDEISIGAAAAQKFQDGMKPGKIQKPSSTEGGAAGAPADAAGAAPVQPGEGAGAAAPDQNRYVDDAGTPLGPGVAAGEAFKRLPVFLKLQMNQLQINTLLTNCVNSPLPLEVRQLRINPEAANEAGPQRAPEGRQQGDAPAATTPGPLDVPVEIHGIIYIYNPPDPTKLGQPAEAGGAVAGG